MLERLIAIGIVAALLFGIASAFKERNDSSAPSTAAPPTDPTTPKTPPSPVAKQPVLPLLGAPPASGHHDGGGKHDKKAPAPVPAPGLLAPLLGSDG